MNFGQLTVATRNRVGVSETDPLLTPGTLGQFVNDAKNYVATVHDWPWQQVMPTTFTTSAGVQDYVMPTDWLRTVDLRIVSTTSNMQDGFTLFSVMELDDRWAPSQQGQPREYAIFGDHLRIAPAPDGPYTVSHRYIKVEADLVSSTDTPIMPAQFHASIPAYAAFLALRMISEESRAQVALADFDRWITIMLQDRRRSTAPQRIRARPGSLI